MCRAQLHASSPFMAASSITSSSNHPRLSTIQERTNHPLSPTKSTTTNNNIMANRKQAFLKRSLAHRTVSFIESEVEKTTSASPFLQSEVEAQHAKHNLSIAPLKRAELQLGELVGQGGFSEVYQLDALDLDACEHDEEDCLQRMDDDESSSSLPHHVSQEVREQLAATAATGGLVVKHLRKDLLTKRKRFQTAAADIVLEAQFLARLDHPHIIKVRGWTASGIASLGDGQHDGYFLVMDKLDCTLAEKIQSWKEQDEETTSCNKKHAVFSIAHLEVKLRYARELASALEYLHRNRLVFRDLKPENIGILNDSIVLFDFGLCRELPESSSGLEDQYQMSGVGTLRYMAPEILQQQAYNQKADVYSFSMVLYEMFFHSKPFDLYTFNMHQLLVCEDQERPPIPSYCPPQLRDLLEDTWDAEPLDRPCLKEIQKQLDQLSSCNGGSSSSWTPRLQLFWQAATRPFVPVLHKHNSFASFQSERTTTTVDESSIGSWFISTN